MKGVMKPIILEAIIQHICIAVNSGTQNSECSVNVCLKALSTYSLHHF